jgi:hypothetical protein
MTLPTSGPISFNDISFEIYQNIATYNLNNPDGRTLAGVPTPNSQISLSDFYGKTYPRVVTGIRVTLIGGGGGGGGGPRGGGGASGQLSTNTPVTLDKN